MERANADDASRFVSTNKVSGKTLRERKANDFTTNLIYKQNNVLLVTNLKVVKKIPKEIAKEINREELRKFYKSIIRRCQDLADILSVFDFVQSSGAIALCAGCGKIFHVSELRHYEYYNEVGVSHCCTNLTNVGPPTWVRTSWSQLEAAMQTVENWAKRTLPKSKDPIGSDGYVTAEAAKLSFGQMGVSAVIVRNDDETYFWNYANVPLPEGAEVVSVWHATSKTWQDL